MSRWLQRRGRSQSSCGRRKARQELPDAVRLGSSTCDGRTRPCRFKTNTRPYLSVLLFLHPRGVSRWPLSSSRHSIYKDASPVCSVYHQPAIAAHRRTRPPGLSKTLQVVNCLSHSKPRATHLAHHALAYSLLVSESTRFSTLHLRCLRPTCSRSPLAPSRSSRSP